MEVLTFARYIQESTLMDYTMNVETSESHLAAAVMYLTLMIKNVEGMEPTLEYYSGYTKKQCEALMRKLHAMLRKPTSESKKTIRTKYSHE